MQSDNAPLHPESCVNYKYLDIFKFIYFICVVPKKPNLRHSTQNYYFSWSLRLERFFIPTAVLRSLFRFSIGRRSGLIAGSSVLSTLCFKPLFFLGLVYMGGSWRAIQWARRSLWEIIP